MGSPAKLKTLKKLLTLRELWRWEGKIVVFTNGVYDILHAGHVQLLEKAKGLGDILVIVPLKKGYSTSSLVRRLGAQARA